MSCKNCLLDGGLKQKPLGKKGAKYLVITKPPTCDEDIYEKDFIRGGASFFYDHLEQNGFDAEDFIFHSYVNCVFDPKEHKVADRKLIINECKDRLCKVIHQMKPEVIITLGADATNSVFAKKVKITKVRGNPQWSDEHDCWIMPMLDPNMVSMLPQHETTMATDIASFKRFVDSGYDMEEISNVYGDYKIVDDLQFLIDEEPAVLSFDCETLGLKPQRKGNKILTMQFSTEPGNGWMVIWDHPERPANKDQKRKIKKQLKQLLQNPNTSVCGQNLGYDAVWVLHTLGFRFRIDDDTLMIAALLDENSIDKSLDMLIKQKVPEMAGYADHFNQMYDKSRMDLVPLQDLLPYGCGDTDAALRLSEVMLEDLQEDEALYTHYRRVSIPAINAFVPVEVRGKLVDVDQMEEFREVLEADLESRNKYLQTQIPRVIKRYHIKHGGLSFSRATLVRDWLFTHPAGLQIDPKVFTKSSEKLKDESLRLPSISTKDHLPYFYDEYPIVRELAEYIKDKRLLDTNIKSYAKNFVINGRIFPSYNLHTAVTGRSASKEPNGQNEPKRGKNAKIYRKAFVAPPGWAILGADLSQAELRIAADMAQDRTMINIYKNNGDIHSSTGAIVLGITDEEFELQSKEDKSLARFKAKAVNFGYIYGMWWKSFIGYAKTQYGVEFTDEEAEQNRKDFFDKYDSLEDWHDAAKAFARENGYVRSYTGRIRHLPTIFSDQDYVSKEAERQAINSPVQETASSLGLMAMAKVDQEIDDQYLQLIGFVHDALYAYVPLEYLEWGAKTLKEYMQHNYLKEYFGHTLSIPIVSDVEFGLNMGEMYEMSGLDIGEDYDFDLIEDLEIDIPEQLTPPDNGRKDIEEHMIIHI